MKVYYGKNFWGEQQPDLKAMEFHLRNVMISDKPRKLLAAGIFSQGKKR